MGIYAQVNEVFHHILQKVFNSVAFGKVFFLFITLKVWRHPLKLKFICGLTTEDQKLHFLQIILTTHLKFCQICFLAHLEWLDNVNKHQREGQTNNIRQHSQNPKGSWCTSGVCFCMGYMSRVWYGFEKNCESKSLAVKDVKNCIHWSDWRGPYI
jgi:hypothetical protein